jgi:hypothetical protein
LIECHVSHTLDIIQGRSCIHTSSSESS